MHAMLDFKKDIGVSSCCQILSAWHGLLFIKHLFCT